MSVLQKKVIIIVLLACGIVAYSFHSLWQKDSAERIAVAPAPGNLPASQNAADSVVDSEIVVYVSGGVNRPGVYKLTQGSRVVDAVNLAGGFAPGADAAKINLALHVKDEMQVNVPYAVTASSPGNSNTGPTSNNSSANRTNNDKININTASAAELDKLPGIGPALAERIAQHRTANGPFGDLTDIKKVPGIGESKYNQFKDKITL